MVHSLFFDLETSDKNPIGQILNYCFLEVDADFRVVSECKGLVKISRVEIPDPEAILANRVDVIEHQKVAEHTEYETVQLIFNYINEVCSKQDQPVPLVGYNSSRFDIPFLRTTFIRNGFNPYFRGRILCRDLYHAVQKAYLMEPTFSEQLRSRGKALGKFSLSLEAVTQTLGLLEGKQAHESEFDVRLTIEVAKYLTQKFAIDVRTLDPCEVVRFYGKQNIAVGSLHANYDLAVEDTARTVPLMLLVNDAKASLWVDLDQYKDGKGRESIRWISANKHAVFVSGELTLNADQLLLARAAQKEFRDVTLRNFFPLSTCDIEQDIYRIDFDGIAAIEEVLCGNSSSGSPKRMMSKDAKILVTRCKMRNANSLKSVERGEDFFKLYALHRYGGKIVLSKSPSKEGTVEFHQSLSQRLLRLAELRNTLIVKSDPHSLESARLLSSLEKFIHSSEVVKIAGKELLLS